MLDINIQGPKRYMGHPIKWRKVESQWSKLLRRPFPQTIDRFLSFDVISPPKATQNTLSRLEKTSQLVIYLLVVDL